MKNTENQITNMKQQTIGVEIEMNSITRRKAAILVGEYFGTRAYDAAREYGYCSWACQDRKGRTWKFQKDCSIVGPEDEKCEMVTPILRYDDIEDLQEIVRILTEKRHMVVSMCRDTKQTKVRTVNKYYFGKKGKK